MAKLSDWNLQKLKMKIDASKARPDRPKIEQQIGLDKSLINMQNDLIEDDKKINNQMFDELNQKWQRNGGGTRGDALISGLTAGIKQGSFMDDKKRKKVLVDFTQKMRDMVADQNIKLFEQESAFNAKKSVEPRIMAYLNSYQKMSPNDRKVYLQNTMDEYNQAAGTDYKILDATGSEPWKVIVSDGEQSTPLDLMDLIKTPEEKKLEYYLNSNEVKQYERNAAVEDSRENRNRNALAAYNESRVQDAQIKRQEHERARNIEKEILDQTGDHVRFIDDMSTSERNYAERHIKEYTEKANNDLYNEKILNRASEIAEKHPELFANLNAIIAARYHEDPGYINNILKNKIPKESQDAASELSGIIKNIFTGSIRGSGVTAKGINQFIEKKLEAGTPNQRWTAAAFKKVVNESEKEYKKSYDEHKKVSDYGSQGIYYRPKAKSRETAAAINPVKTDQAEIDKKLKAIPGVTQADIDEAERRLKSGQ